jgi:hypothetical protein
MLFIILIVCVCKDSSVTNWKYISSDGRVFDSFAEYNWYNNFLKSSCKCLHCVRGLSSCCEGDFNYINNYSSTAEQIKIHNLEFQLMAKDCEISGLKRKLNNIKEEVN